MNPLILASSLAALFYVLPLKRFKDRRRRRDICYQVIFPISIHIFVTILLLQVRSTPPDNPIKCTNQSTNKNCTLTNSYGAFPDRSICRAAEAAYPRTEEELIAVVAAATRENRKMKAATRSSHSIPKLACPGSGSGDGLLISTMHLNRTLKVDKQSMTMTVESGVSLRQLINDAAEAGLALPHTPYWWGVTVGGMMGTGAHGSTLRGRGSAFHDHVVRVRIVTPASPEEGYAAVRQLEEDDPEINAARVSLGVLGVISQVTLRLEPMFKRAVTFVEEDDGNLGEEIIAFGCQHEFGDMTWFPSQRRVVKRIDDRVKTNASSNGLNNFLGFRSAPSLVSSLVRIAEENMQALSDGNGKCILANISTFILKVATYGFTNNGVIFTGYPIIGSQNRLQSAGTCLDSLNDGLLTTCPWDPRIKGLFFHQTTFSISLSKVKGFVQEVQQLVNLDQKALCGLGLYNGILIRYVTSSSAYLGKQYDAVDFDITYYRSKDPMAPRLYQDFIEEIEQLAIFKYKALPHWGKNRNVAFLRAKNKYAKFDEFLKVKERYDPKALFSSDWTNQVLGLREGLEITKDSCALEGLCICSQDSHCAPSKGYFCRPGKLYSDARVCAETSTTL
ncbi:hypothetical protein DM860_002387 [Cuscuta australis]|uniref:L-gulonolactone oxidase n=1 Tax=Cuscuta australis TaxID=267555 RepID=A0A328D1Z4_9ASTE|nr:hypothetical protein DM860_002387 [Cuscuta australis]